MIHSQFSEDASIVTNLFKFMTLAVFQNDASAIVYVTAYENLEDMLAKATVKTENWYIRNEVLKRFKELICSRSQTEDMKTLVNIVKIMLFDIQPHTEQYESRCFNFYECISLIVDSLALADIEILRP